jgi:hypothetical protein
MEAGMIIGENYSCEVYYSQPVTIHKCVPSIRQPRELGFHSCYEGDQIKDDEMGSSCSTHLGEIRNALKILVGKPEVKRAFVRPRHRLDDNIKCTSKANCAMLLYFLNLASY